MTTTTGFLNKLAQQCREDSDRWFGDTTGHGLVHHTLSLCGEAGELANIVKKIDRGSLDYKDPKVRVQLAGEMTDVLVYLLNIAGICGVDLEKSYQHVRANNERRFMQERRIRDERRSNGDH